jgi:tetratricopeptide (TPR) repeat protein
MKKFLLFVFILSLTIPTFSQTKEDLIKQLGVAKSDTLKSRLLTDLASQAMNEGDTSYCIQLRDFTKEKLKNTSLDADSRIKLLRGFCAALDGIAFTQQQSGHGKKAIDIWNEVLELNKEIKDKNIEGNCLVNIAYVTENMGNLPVAIDLYHKGLICLDRKGGDVNALGAVFNNLASIYRTQGDLDKALEYFQKGLELQKNATNKLSTAYLMDNMAGIYQHKGKLQEAEELWNKALAIHTAMKNKLGMAAVYQSLTGAERAKGNFQKALELTQNALKLRIEIDDKLGIARAYAALGSIYVQMKEYQKAKESCEEGYKRARQLKYPSDEANMLLGLAIIYEKLGDFKKAYHYEVAFKAMADSVNKENSKRLALKKNFEYAFQKQAAQDSVKTAETQKVYNAEIKHQKTQSMALYIGLGLVAIFSIFMYNRFRITQKQKKIIEEQKHLVDEKQKEIIQSIQYAKRIQQALMPSEKRIQKNLNELM